jgi:small subunit ribosomal protein S16
MVKIRLSRTGTTKRPCYRIVAVDSRRRRETRVLEILGTYEPRQGGRITLDDAAAERWLALGAQPSETVGALLRTRRRELESSAAASA